MLCCGDFCPVKAPRDVRVRETDSLDRNKSIFFSFSGTPLQKRLWKHILRFFFRAHSHLKLFWRGRSHASFLFSSLKHIFEFNVPLITTPPIIFFCNRRLGDEFYSSVTYKPMGAYRCRFVDLLQCLKRFPLKKKKKRNVHNAPPK